ncbi:globin domain-containing protein [Streptosporangium pseudovulgare]|uniref:nitric oxide dioxygenase n=1 Tax=Streptosporangium pseudovulgare TaxID=35765 RepID=A0ABQ2QG30_9ACTN|nr:globin domain-containing protein [Streptosporangium pseudovulgare]GGP79199.1 hemin transporter [Streptosporangium pseudovulgare]
MLSAESAAIVRSTLPVIGASLDDITARFYDSMFADRPELLDGLFNRGNQASGAQRRALAGSIAAFATMLLDNPGERPDALLARIAHKHTSLGVTDDQYVIVHKYLFGAIAEVLGDAVTPDVAAAWDEVYWLMAGSLIAMEARLYGEAGIADGDSRRQWRVVGRREETPDVVSFLLRPADGGPIPPARPGQYVSVEARMPDGVRQLRQYSLSGTDSDGIRRITVKRVRGEGGPDGEVSNLLHATVREGDELTLTTPFGDVALEDGDAPLVLASAGIGCTPMVAMLEHLVGTGSTRRVLVLHADRSPADHALREDTERLVAALPDATRILWYEDGAADGERSGWMDLAGVEIPEGATVYLCGPLPFMRVTRSALIGAGVAARDVHYEVFGPDLWLGAEG